MFHVVVTRCYEASVKDGHCPGNGPEVQTGQGFASGISVLKLILELKPKRMRRKHFNLSGCDLSFSDLSVTCCRIAGFSSSEIDNASFQGANAEAKNKFNNIFPRDFIKMT